MQRDTILSVAILLIEILGFGLGAVVIYRLNQQIGALKGTVDAQRQTVQTLSDLNRTALEMTKAFDPKKYAELD